MAKVEMNHWRALLVGVPVPLMVAYGCTVWNGPIIYEGGGGDSSSTSSSSGTGGSSSSSSSSGAGGMTSSSSSSSSGTGGTMSTTSTGSGGQGGGGAPSCGLPVNDQFDAGPLDPCWEVLDPARFATREIANGSLDMTPASIGLPDHNGWYANWHGPLLYREITAQHFIIVAKVTVSAATNHDDPPVGDYNTAGILVRDPFAAPSHDNWVIYDIGQQGGATDTPNVGLGTMSKITLDAQSTKFPEDSNGSRQGLLAICRKGDTIEVLDRLYQPDRAFRRARTFTSWTSIPATLHVGLTVGTWNDPSNVAGHFDFVRIKAINPQDDCLTVFQDVFSW